MLNGDSEVDTLTTCRPDTQVRRTPRGQGIEARRIQKQLDSFDVKSSHVWGILQATFSSGVTHNELRSIAQLVCLQTRGAVALSRSENRDGRMLIKWFSENWGVVQPVLDRIRILDSNFCEVNLERELRESVACKGRM